MSSVQNFAFDETLVRVVLKEQHPWFVGADACRALGIQNTSKALGRLDEDEKGITNSDTLGGSQAMLIVSEPGLYRLIFTSRVPAADRFKRWLAHEVIPQIRRTGSYVADDPSVVASAQLTSAPDRDPQAWPIIQRLQAVQLCARIHGRARAEVLWRHLGLPAVPPPPLTAIDDARQCLRHVLDLPAHQGGPSIRTLIEAALEDDEQARLYLLPIGIRPCSDQDGFIVANSHPALHRAMQRTEWGSSFFRVLRRLPGARPVGTSRFEGRNMRGTFLPAELLDEASI